MNRNFQTLALAFFLLFIKCNSEVDAQVSSLLTWGLGARSLGMGRVAGAFSNDVSGVYYNSACLHRLQKFEFLGSYALLYGGNHFAFLGLVGPTRYGSAALAVSNLYAGDLVSSDSSGNIAEKFGFSFTAVFFSFGSKLNNIVFHSDFIDWAVGISGKIMRESISDLQSVGFGIDIGNFAAANFRNCSFLFGVNLQNFFSSKLKFLVEEEVPLSLRISAGISLFDGKGFVGTDMIIVRSFYEITFGGEYNFWELLSLRAGINEREVSLGIGLRRGDIEVGYALLIHRNWRDINLGVLHTIDVKVRWLL